MNPECPTFQRLACIVCAIVALAPHAPCMAQSQPWPPPYAVFELPTLGGTPSYGWTLDDRGNAVGSATLANRDFHATIWLGGQQPIDLGTLGGPDSACRGINQDGSVVGWAHTGTQSGFDSTAFLWRNGQMTSLGYLGTGDYSEAYGINDLNQIVGRSTIDMSQYPPVRAFLWQNGQMSALPITPEYNNSEATAINNAGLIVGTASSLSYFTWRPVIWRDGQIIDLGTFLNDNRGTGVCIDVNQHGDVVGYASTEPDRYPGAFLYRNGQMHYLGKKREWIDSTAWAINESRQIVGAGETENLDRFGCIWEWNQPLRVLDELIPPRSNWRIQMAFEINNAGQITGEGFRRDNPDSTKGYLLSPVHPTMELSQPSPGLANAENTLTVTGAAPGARVTFLYSRHGGGTAIPGCTLQINCLQLDAPKIIGRATADAEGRATITAFVPPAAAGETILLQTCVKEQCAVSQLVVHEFE